MVIILKRLFIIVVIFVVATFFVIESKNDNNIDNEKRAIFVSYADLERYIDLNKVDYSKKNIDTIIDNIVSNNFNMIILHVRAFSDAIYESSIYPVSMVIADSENDSLTFDVLEYFINKAHDNNIEIHAWINPYRIRSNTNVDTITNKNPAYKYLGTNHVQIIENKGIYYNPASSVVLDLILNGIEEIIDNYDIDGIHFDDYFYPSDTIDLDNYKDYVNKGGELSLSEYRLNNISNLLKGVYELVKSKDGNIVFGISPEGNLENNYNNNYLDVKKILSNYGYIDYVMPQIYYGFDNGAKPFLEVLNSWNDLIKIDIPIIPALALYKSGKYDSYAKDGAFEWQNNSDIISRQIIESRKVSKYGGFSIFSYKYLFDDYYNNASLIEERIGIINLIK